MHWIAGAAVGGTAHHRTSLAQTDFVSLRKVVIDPLTPGGTKLYACDQSSIRVIDTRLDRCELLVGGDWTGMKDGGEPKFNGISDMLITADGRTLLITDTSNNRIRSVDIMSRSARTVCGTGGVILSWPPWAAQTDGPGAEAVLYRPEQLAFDETDFSTRESQIYFTARDRIIKYNFNQSMALLALEYVR